MTQEKIASHQTSADKLSDDPQVRAEKLREDITRTRSALSEDLRALGDKLNPEQLKEDAKEVIQHATSAAREGAKHMVRDARDAAVDSLRSARDHAFDSLAEGVEQVGARARVVGHNVSDFVATHAVPLTLLGAGAGWLLVSMSHQRRLQRLSSSPYGEGGYAGREPPWSGARERAHEIGERATSALAGGRERLMDRAHELQSAVGERVGELRAQVKEGAIQLGHGAAELGQRTYHGVERAGARAVEVSEQNPLAIGLLALAAGAAVAMLLPPTRRENALLGETRDRLLHDAQEKAGELKSSVLRGAEELRGAIGDLRQPGHHA